MPFNFLNFLGGSSGATSTAGGIGYAQSGWNLIKDILGIDYSRNYDLNADLMELQQGYTHENMELANQYNVDMWNRNKDFTQDMFNQNVQANKDFAAQQQQYNTENMAKQFQYNAMLSDAGRAIAQQRMAGINPNAVGAARASGSIGLPASGMPSAPNVGAPGMAAMGATSPAASNSTASHYMADANNLVEAGLKLDTKLSEIKKRNAEAKISSSEAAMRDKLLQTTIQTAITNANAALTESEAHALQVQVDAGYKAAQVEIQKQLNKIRERGVIVDESKVQSTVLNALADTALKLQSAQSEEQVTEILRKQKVFYVDQLFSELDLKRAQKENFEGQTGMYEPLTDKAEKDVIWYEIKTLIDGAIGAAFARGLGSAGRISVKGFK